MNFGISGIWQHPQTTIPALLGGVGLIVVALGYCDSATWEKYATTIGAVAIALVGALYKGQG